MSRTSNSRARIYEWLSDYMSTHIVAPSLAEIGKALHLSTSVVQYHLKSLEAAGALIRGSGHRNLALTAPGKQKTWISVADLLPPDEQKVLAVTRTSKGRQNIVIAYYIAEKQYWASGMNSNVTHWMPLPELPEADDGEHE